MLFGPPCFETFLQTFFLHYFYNHQQDNAMPSIKISRQTNITKIADINVLYTHAFYAYLFCLFSVPVYLVGNVLICSYEQEAKMLCTYWQESSKRKEELDELCKAKDSSDKEKCNMETKLDDMRNHCNKLQKEVDLVKHNNTCTCIMIPPNYEREWDLYSYISN